MLREFRQEYGLTQDQLAKELGVTRQSIYNIEQGRSTMSEEVLGRFRVLRKQYQERYELDVMIDWLHIQFDVVDPDFIIKDVLHMNPLYFNNSDTKQYNYGSKRVLDKIVILVCDDRRQDMGCLLSLTGQGCRLLEKCLIDWGVTWFDFLRHAVNKGGKVTRIDLALDDYVEYFKLSDVVKKIEKGELQTSFRRIEPKYNLEYQDDNEHFEKVGVTVYFGSRSSQLRLCLYQKNYELARKYREPVTSFAVKNRYELRFMDEYAQKITLELLKNQDLADVTLGVLFQRVTFYERDKKTTWKPWARLMDGVKKIELKIDSKVTSYEKQLRYFKESYARSLKTLLEIDEANGWSNVEDYLFDLKLTEKYTDILTVMTTDEGEKKRGVRAWKESTFHQGNA